MSIDVHHGPAPAALHDPPTATIDEFDLDPQWSETVVTVFAATVTIGFVSFVAVIMALA